MRTLPRVAFGWPTREIYHRNLLAQSYALSEDRSAMNSWAGRANVGRACVAALASAAFLWALLLSASPELHQRVHPDANGIDHSCAVTMVASGNYDHAAQPLGSDKPTQRCADFLKTSEKASQQWQLEHRYQVFESSIP